jgi:cytidylate kinase
LKEHPRVLNVYIYAPYEKRLENCITRLEMSEKVAKKMIAEVDAARENYHRLYIPEYRSPLYNSDLCINSSTNGVSGTAEIIADVARRKFGA